MDDEKIPYNDPNEDGTIPYNDPNTWNPMPAEHAQIPAPLSEVFSKQLVAMQDAGFHDQQLNIQCLLRTRGNVNEAVSMIMDL